MRTPLDRRKPPTVRARFGGPSRCIGKPPHFGTEMEFPLSGLALSHRTRCGSESREPPPRLRRWPCANGQQPAQHLQHLNGHCVIGHWALLLAMPRFFDYLAGALAEGQPFAVGIISGIKGSSPQKQGAKALFYLDGRIQGTLGAGCLESEIQDRARRALLSQTPACCDLVLGHDFGWDGGLICGAKVSGL